MSYPCKHVLLRVCIICDVNSLKKKKKPSHLQMHVLERVDRMELMELLQRTK